MPVFYHAIDRRGYVTQPELTRWNHRYRGPRESYKINAEISQSLYDIRRVYERTTSVRTRFETQMTAVLGGGEVAPEVGTVGSDDLADRLSRLTERIRKLEA